MCGLFGASWARDVDATTRGRILAILAKGASWRGRHSWGVALIERDPHSGDRTAGSVSVERGLGSVADAPIEHWLDADVVIGHARFATTGAVTIENAHPFTMPAGGDRTLVGAHNGTLSNHAELNTKHGRAFPVDSMHIVAHLAAGLDLAEIASYGVVTYVYSDDVRVRLGRWNGGELEVWRTPFGLIWCSTKAPITDALRACGVNSAIAVKVYAIEEGTEYIVDGDRLVVEAPGRFNCGARALRAWDAAIRPQASHTRSVASIFDTVADTVADKPRKIARTTPIADPTPLFPAPPTPTPTPTTRKPRHAKGKPVPNAPKNVPNDKAVAVGTAIHQELARSYADQSTEWPASVSVTLNRPDHSNSIYPRLRRGTDANAREIAVPGETCWHCRTKWTIRDGRGRVVGISGSEGLVKAVREMKREHGPVTSEAPDTRRPLAVLMDRAVEDDRGWTGRAECSHCRQVVGTIDIRSNTMFGHEEDRRVLNAPDWFAKAVR